MPLGDTLNQTSQATQGLSGNDTSGGAVAPVDSARGDLGGRKTKDAGEVNKTRDGDKPSSLRIKIELDLDVEVHLSARVKGDITIGLL